MGKKNYGDDLVTTKNIPHLREKTIMIFCGWLFLGMNAVLEGVLKIRCFGDVDGNYYCIMGSFILFGSNVLAMDCRRSNRDTGAVIAIWLFSYLAFLKFLMMNFSWILIGTFILEIFVCVASVFISCKK